MERSFINGLNIRRKNTKGLKKINKPHIVTVFDRPGDYSKALEELLTDRSTTNTHAKAARYCVDQTGRHDSKWGGGRTAVESLELLARGDKKLAQRARKLMAQIVQATDETPKAKRVHAVAGGRVRVPAVLAGARKPMTRRKVLMDASGPLSIVVNATSSANVSADMLEKKGIAVAALIAKLQTIRPVSLYVMTCAKHEGSGQKRYRRTEISSFDIIKLPTSPMDLSRLVLWCCDQGFARTLGFASALNNNKRYQDQTGEATQDWYTGSIDWPISHTYVNKKEFKEDLEALLRTQVHYMYPSNGFHGDVKEIHKDPVAWVNKLTRELS